MTLRQTTSRQALYCFWPQVLVKGTDNNYGCFSNYLEESSQKSYQREHPANSNSFFEKHPFGSRVFWKSHDNCVDSYVYLFLPATTSKIPGSNQ